MRFLVHYQMMKFLPVSKQVRLLRFMKHGGMANERTSKAFYTNDEFDVFQSLMFGTDNLRMPFNFLDREQIDDYFGVDKIEYDVIENIDISYKGTNYKVGHNSKITHVIRVFADISDEDIIMSHLSGNSLLVCSIYDWQQTDNIVSIKRGNFKKWMEGRFLCQNQS